MWWKKHKWKIILPVLIAAILAAAFWYGGGAPGQQGWTAEALPSPVPSAAPEKSAETPAPTQEIAPEEPEPTAGQASEPPLPSAPPPADSGSLEGDAAHADPDDGKTEPPAESVPAETPLPSEPQETAAPDTPRTCTLSISCATVLDHMDWLDPEKAELIPADGWILQPTAVTFYEGESVFNVLQRTCKQLKIHMEFENTPLYSSAYIEGIQNLYEFDCGERSGWMYKVNDWFPNYGCSRYQLKDGDTVCWVYTCDLGADVGGGDGLQKEA